MLQSSEMRRRSAGRLIARDSVAAILGRPTAPTAALGLVEAVQFVGRFAAGATPPATTIATSSVPDRTNARAQSSPAPTAEPRLEIDFFGELLPLGHALGATNPVGPPLRTSAAHGFATPVIGRPCMSVTTIVTPSSSADTAATASATADSIPLVGRPLRRTAALADRSS